MKHKRTHCETCAAQVLKKTNGVDHDGDTDAATLESPQERLVAKRLSSEAEEQADSAHEHGKK